MTYHYSWLCLLTLTYDLTYDLWLSSMTITYDLWLWPITITYHLWLPLTTHNCHSCFIHNHDLSHLSITHDYHLWLSSMTITHEYHTWPSPVTMILLLMTMFITYGHHLWTSGLMPYGLHLMTHHFWVSHKTVTHDYHSWLWTSQLTMSITWLTTADHDHHPWTWLPPMTMNITHNLSPPMTSSHHSWSITSPMTSSHHSWLSPLCVTYDCHRCLITHDTHHSWPSLMTITNDHHTRLSPMTMTTIHCSWLWLLTPDWHLCLITHVFSLMFCLSCLWLMTYGL